MALSVRLAPELEARLEEEARRLGISKSDFVKDALERSLGLKNPATLLDQVRAELPEQAAEAQSNNVHAAVPEKLRGKHSH